MIHSTKIYTTAFFICAVLLFVALILVSLVVIFPVPSVYAQQAPFGSCVDNGAFPFCELAFDQPTCESAPLTCMWIGSCVQIPCNSFVTELSCGSSAQCMWVFNPVCNDGLDNDGDKRIDFPNDPGCVDANDDNETNTPPPPATFFVSPIFYTFPPTTVGLANTTNFQIQNTGAVGAPSIIGSVTGLLAPFSCIGGSCIYSLLPGMPPQSPTIRFAPIVASPPPFSDIATFTVNPGVDSPLCSATQAAIPRDTACGLYLDSINQGVIIKLCQGNNPQVSCPIGFIKVGEWYFEDGHNGYQAVCYRDGGGPPSPGGAYTCGLSLQSATLGWLNISCESSSPQIACPAGYTQVGPWYFQDGTAGSQATCVGNDAVLSANDFAPGAHCGLYLERGTGAVTTVPCLGHSPNVSCPAGFDRVYWFYEGENDQGYRGVCIKQ